jgi:hypothetical protein
MKRSFSLADLNKQEGILPGICDRLASQLIQTGWYAL